MAKIDKQITRTIKDGNYDEVPTKINRDNHKAHTHKYPVQIRETVKQYENEYGITANNIKRMEKQNAKLENKKLETRISKRQKARKAYENALKESVYAEHTNAVNEMAMGD